MKTISTFKFNTIFFVLYACLMGSLIFFGLTYSQTNNQKTEVKTNEVSSTFSKELKIYENEKKQKELNQKNRWKPSKPFVITAVGISSVLDIFIILLWARHENKKRRAAELMIVSRKHWSNSPMFWKIISMGMLQIKNERIHIHWINTFIVVVLMLILKFLLTKIII